MGAGAEVATRVLSGVALAVADQLGDPRAGCGATGGATGRAA